MKKFLFILILSVFFNTNSFSAFKSFEAKCTSDHKGKLKKPVVFKFFKISPGNWKVAKPGENEPSFNVMGNPKGINKKNEFFQWTFAQIFSKDSGFLFEYLFNIKEQGIVVHMLELDESKIKKLKKAASKLSSSKLDGFKYDMIRKENSQDTYAGRFENCGGSIHNSKY